MAVALNYSFSVFFDFFEMNLAKLKEFGLLFSFYWPSALIRDVMVIWILGGEAIALHGLMSPRGFLFFFHSTYVNEQTRRMKTKCQCACS